MKKQYESLSKEDLLEALKRLEHLPVQKQEVARPINGLKDAYEEALKKETEGVEIKSAPADMDEKELQKFNEELLMATTGMSSRNARRKLKQKVKYKNKKK